MGAAGDMLASALLELLDDPDGFVASLNELGIPQIVYRRDAARACGIVGSHLTVAVDGVEEACSHAHGRGCEHGHADVEVIERLVSDRLSLPEEVRKDVLAVFGLIAEAESAVHGAPVDQIHFHEVGTMDAIADVAAACMLLHRLAPDEVVVSPINVGGGQVACAHGVLPVPAPATAFILRDVPLYGGDVESELCTPTGAALLKHFATRFGRMPIMRVHAIGYGMGTKRFERANCVRALLGETDGDPNDAVVKMACTIDDMTAEEVGFAIETLLAVGALEAYAAPVTMKKSRPGTLLTVICREEDRDRIVRLVFAHTSTIGVRESFERRYALDRSITTLSTSYGDVRAKASSGYGVHREKLEYEDLARIARETNASIADVRRAVLREHGR